MPTPSKRPKTRPCACGCGAAVVVLPGHRPRKYATDACRQYAYRLRKGMVWGSGFGRRDGRSIGY